jgi:hypothetical protein
MADTAADVPPLDWAVFHASAAASATRLRSVFNPTTIARNESAAVAVDLKCLAPPSA